MVDFTIVNPTKNPFKTGTNINQPCIIGIIAPFNPTIGNGTVVTFTPSVLMAKGNYNAWVGSGTFNISVTPSGANFLASFQLTGTFAAQSQSFTATATQTGSNAFQLVSLDKSLSLTVSQDNGGWGTDGKIDVKPSWAAVTLYIDSNVSATSDQEAETAEA
ncbi:hypothetical protein [Ancylobacter radicis]|uniref:Uncharacterized protein n=1 Tax=Ancylobacter radicis TaxID=2836179 RepID=A0ABS5R358_9HYPH|nr:hypothetical protein [Ancylobacter radicis]MBS9476089.1 hypothetical protein [Ancylobacter radicis]